MITSYQRFMRFFLTGWFLALFAPALLANVVGPSMQNFNPAPSGVDFLTVQSSETLAPGVYNLGIFANYAVNSLPVFDDGNSVQKRTDWNDSLLMTDFNLALGLVRNLEIGFAYPRLVRQKVDTDAPRGQFGATGNTEIRFLTKFRFFGNSKSGLGTVLSTNINRTRNNPYSGIGAKPTYNFELVGDWTVAKVALGANIGYRWFQQGEPIPNTSITPVDDQLIGSAAISYLIQAIDSKLIAEIFGSRPAKKYESAASNRQASSLELIGGVKHDVTTNIALHGGAGTELISGASSPDWRIYAGVNIANGPLWGKKRKRSRVTKTKRNPTEALAVEPPPETDADLEVIPGESVVTLGNIQFDFNSSDIMLPGSDETLAMLATHLMKPPVFKSLNIEGHTDSIGSREFNADLSQKRADHIRRILIEKFHLDGNKIKATGFGEDKPIGDNGNFQGRQENRRVEFRIDR